MFGGNFSLLHQMTSIVTTIFINNLDFFKESLLGEGESLLHLYSDQTGTWR